MRGQSTMESMVVFAASIAMAAILGPAYQSALSLAASSNLRASAQSAASQLSWAASLVATAGDGAAITGDVMLPNGTRLDGSSGSIRLQIIGGALNGTDFFVSDNCALSDSCGSGQCHYSASFHGSCLLSLEADGG